MQDCFAGRHLRAEMLEDRSLLSIALSGTEAMRISDAAAPGPEMAAVLPAPFDAGIPSPASARGNSTPASRHELVIVDSALEQHARAFSSVDALEVYVLDAGRVGVEQVGRILEGRRELSAVHLFAHGRPGAILLAGNWIDAGKLQRDASVVARWGDSLAEDGDVLLYGCDVAADSVGAAFVEQLAALTGADVAASRNATGAAASGGDWVLEYATGSIETEVHAAAALLDRQKILLGSVVAWGDNTYGQQNVPAGLEDAVAIAAGAYHTVALRANGTVVAWGRNDDGQANVPAGLTDVIAVAAGDMHSVALKSDGTIVTWGSNSYGQTAIPWGLNDVVAIAAGPFHNVARRGDGTVVAWGSNTAGQSDEPVGLANVAEVAGGLAHTLVRKADGTLAAWGSNSSSQTNIPAGLANVAAIAVGDSHNLARKADGTVVAWGYNGYGQTNVPAGLLYVADVAAAGNHSLALKGNGTVVAWGENSHGQSSVPAGLVNVVDVAAGLDHSVALVANESPVAWGNNDYGQAIVPGGLTAVADVDAGDYHNLAREADGTVTAWGYNYWGQTNVLPGLSHVIDAVAGGHFTLALTATGSVVGWGQNDYGQATPTIGLNNVVHLAAGNRHALALRADGTVVAWGYNSYGQVNVPAGLNNVVSIAAGKWHSLAVKADGTVVAWGKNEHGQLDVPGGLGGVVGISGGDWNSMAATHDGTLAFWGSGWAPPAGVTGAVQVELGTYQYLVRKSDGLITTWGSNFYGEASPPVGLSRVTDLGAGYQHSIALGSIHPLPMVGNDQYELDEDQTFMVNPTGVLANDADQDGAPLTAHLVTGPAHGSLTLNPSGSFLYQPNPDYFGADSFTYRVYDGIVYSNPATVTLTVRAAQDPPTARDDHYLANQDRTLTISALTVLSNDVDVDGDPLGAILQGFPSHALSFGFNTDGSFTYTPQPGYVGPDSFTYKAFDGQAYSDVATVYLTVRPVGVPVAWGNNNVGQTAVPAGLADVVAIAAGESHALAVTADGAVVAWGYNNYGQINVPAGLPAVVAVAAGERHSLAVKRDGTVVGWGDNSFAQAAPPAGLNDVVAVAAGAYHSLAVRSDGTVVTWGINSSGQASVPPGMNDVFAVDGGEWHSVAVRSDGNLVAWGYNGSGAGSVPAGLSGVIAVSAGNFHNVAAKSDGTVVAWGENSLGQTNVPAGLSGVVDVAGGRYHSLALKSDGTVSQWGSGGGGVPGGLNNVVEIAAGGFFSLALVRNERPEADAGGPYALEVGQDLALDGSASSDPDEGSGDAIVSYAWDLDGDGQFDDATGATPTVSWAMLQGLGIEHPADPATGLPVNTVGLRVTDTFAAQSTAQSELRIYDNRPLASLTASPNPAAPTQTITFDGSGSSHGRPDRSIVQYQWDFGDGTTYTETAASAPDGNFDGISTHSYNAFGSHTVTLTVTDDNAPAKTSSVAVEVQVNQGNRAPVGNPGGPYAIDIGQSLLLDGSGSSDPDAAFGDDIVSYAWDLGADGSYEYSGATAFVPWTVLARLPRPNVAIPVRLRVTDAFGTQATADAELKISDSQQTGLRGSVVAWGNNNVGQTSVPAGLADVVAIATGESHALAVTADGAVVAWGRNHYGQINVPAGLTDVVAVAAGERHSLALRRDGTVVGWGDNSFGQAAPPAGLDDVVAIAAGAGHSLAVRSDGTVTAWGINGNGQTSVPPGTTDVTAVDGGEWHSVAAKMDGTVIAWGYNGSGQGSVPAGLSGVIAVSAGSFHNVAAKSDGTVVAWGDNALGQTNVPAGLSGVVDVAGGRYHTLALKSDGTVSQWGSSEGSPPAGLHRVIDVAAGNYFSLALVRNERPEADAGGPYVLEVGQDLALDGSASSDPDEGSGDAIVSYAWDLDGDGQFDDATGATPTLSWATLQSLGIEHPADPATGLPANTIGLRVTDTFGAQSTSNTELKIYDNRPFASLTASPNPAAPTQTLTFDASGSSHGRPDRSIVQYQWDFGDGTTYAETAANAPDGAFDGVTTHSFGAFGSYTATLIVTDDNAPAKTSSVAVEVQVNQDNRAPVPIAGGPYAIDIGQSLLLDGSGSSDPDAAFGDGIVSYAWDLQADGSYEYAGATVTVPWAALAGLPQPNVAIPVRLRVTDTFGAQSTSNTELKIYDNRPFASLTASPNPAAPTQTLTFDASGSSHGRPDRSIVQYQWDFGDGTTYAETASSAPDGAFDGITVHSYGVFGNYTATLTVTDDNGPPKTSSVAVEVQVNQGNRAPVADAGGPYAVNIGQNLLLDGSGSSDPDAVFGDSIASYRWDLGDDGVWDSSGVQGSVPWADLEERPWGEPLPVRLEVTDRFGLTGSRVTSLTIDPPLLETVDFLLLEGLDPSAGDVWYRLTASREGMLTIEALREDGVQVSLFDQSLVPLGTSSPSDGQHRLDHPASAGQMFYIQLSGTAEEVDLRIANLVQHTGTTINVYGTDRDDEFTFDASLGRQITIKGVGYAFTEAEAVEFLFDGGSGTDHVSLLGGEAADTAILRPGRAVLRSDGYTVAALHTESSSFDGGTGTDIVRLYGSRRANTLAAGSDPLDSDPTLAVLAGSGVSISAKAEETYVHGQDGKDTVTWNELPDTGSHQSFWKWTRTAGADYIREVRGFGEVQVGTAILPDAAVDQTYYLSSNESIRLEDLAQILLLDYSKKAGWEARPTQDVAEANNVDQVFTEWE